MRFTTPTLFLLALLLGAASPNGCKPQHLQYHGELNIEESDYYNAPVGAHPFALSIRELRGHSGNLFRSEQVSYNFSVQLTRLGNGLATGASNIDISIPNGERYAVVTAELGESHRNYDKIFFVATTSLESSTLNGLTVYGVRKGSTRVTRIAWAGALPEAVAAHWVSNKEWELRRQSVIAER